MKNIFGFLCIFISATVVEADMVHNPWLGKMMSTVEYLPTSNGDIVDWEIDSWYGRDLSKFWLKGSGEHSSGGLDDTSIELVYSRATNAFWDQQFGVRHDPSSNTLGGSRNWISYGYIGTAPYFFFVDARVFIGEQSSSQLLIEIERELMLTQQWVLTPEIDITANGSTKSEFLEGSGLSEIEFTLRLGYERNGYRKFQPYVGVSARQVFGSTKDLTEAAGNKSSSLNAVVGMQFWF